MLGLTRAALSTAGRPKSNFLSVARRAAETDEESLEAIRQNWCFGRETFKQELLQRVEGQIGEHHSGALHRERSQVRADRIIAEESSRLGWTNQDLTTARKSDPNKLAIATRLRKETTLPIKEIAARVCLGTSKSANATLHRFMKGGMSGIPTNKDPELGI